VAVCGRRGRSGRAGCRGSVVQAGNEKRGDCFTRRPVNAMNASPLHDRGRSYRKFPIFHSALKMSSLTSSKAKGKRKATDYNVMTFDDPGETTDSESLSGFSSDSNSDGDSDSDSSSVSDSGSGSGPESESGAKPEAGAEEEPPLSRDDLLVYLENMRRQFSKKPPLDSFADQQEEVLIVTSKKT